MAGIGQQLLAINALSVSITYANRAESDAYDRFYIFIYKEFEEKRLQDRTNR